MASKLKRYFGNIFVGVDEFLNTILGGESDETLSSRCHRMDGKQRYLGFLRVWIDAIFFWDPGHCLSSYINGELRRQVPPQDR